MIDSHFSAPTVQDRGCKTFTVRCSTGHPVSVESEIGRASWHRRLVNRGKDDCVPLGGHGLSILRSESERRGGISPASHRKAGQRTGFMEGCGIIRKHFSRDSVFVNALSSSETKTIRQYVLSKDSQITGMVPVGYPVEDMDVLILDESVMSWVSTRSARLQSAVVICRRGIGKDRTLPPRHTAMIQTVGRIVFFVRVSGGDCHPTAVSNISGARMRR